MNFKLISILFLAVLLGACSRGGGGGGGPLPDTTPEPVDPFFKSGVKFDNARMQNGAVGDFNGDGFEDLVVTYMGSGTVQPWVGVPIKIFLQDKTTGELVDSTAQLITGPAPAISLARWIEVKDLNHDGLDDIYFGNHGLEPDTVAQFDRYETDVLLLSSGGTYSNVMSANVPVFDVPAGFGFDTSRDQTQDFFTHGVDSADINGDDHIDLVVNMLGGPGIVLLINDGTGKFTSENVFVDIPNRAADLWMHFIDVNLDTYPDLMIGDNTASEHVVLINDQTGSFGNPVQLPPTILDGYIEAAHTADIDKNGLPDLVIGNTSIDFSFHFEQVLINNGDNTFDDVTDTAHPEGLKNADNGNALFHVRDFDGDGDEDMLVVHGNGFNNETGLYLLDNGTFKRVTGTLEGLSTSFVPIDIGNDGNIDIVGTTLEGTFLYKSKKKLEAE